MPTNIPPNSFLTFNLIELDALSASVPDAENSRSITTLVFVDSEDHTPENLVLLNKILSAVNIDPANDTIILALEKSDAPSLHAITERFDPQNILFFGVVPARTGLKFRMTRYDLIRHRERNYLLSDTLTSVATEVPHKRALWGALQALKQD